MMVLVTIYVFADDDSDTLFVVQDLGNGKWCLVENTKIVQVKLDLIQLDLEEPLSR